MQTEIQINFENLNESIITYFQNNDDSLADAKELFSTFINSNRQLERVKNVENLLELLKRVGQYGSHKFNTFRVFQKIINDERYKELVQKHKQLLNSQPSGSEVKLKNYYADRSAIETQNNIIPQQNHLPTSNMQQQSENIKPPLDNLMHKLNISESEGIAASQIKRNEIFNAIADRISANTFRKLARHLDFTGPEIKDIEVMCIDCHTRTIYLLGSYEKKGYSLKKLLKVLEFIGFKDLVYDINQILDR